MQISIDEYVHFPISGKASYTSNLTNVPLVLIISSVSHTGQKTRGFNLP